MKAAEQLANVRGRLGWEIVDKATRHLDAMKSARDGRAGGRGKARAAARAARADAERSLRQAVDTRRRADRSVARAARTKLIDRRADDGTGEPASGRRTSAGRWSTGPPGGAARIQRNLQQMKASYQDAQDDRREERRHGPLLSRLESSRRRRGAACRHAPMARAWIARRRRSSGRPRRRRAPATPDFWSVVGETELRPVRGAGAGGSSRPARKQLAQGLRGSAQARDGDADVGVGVRHRLPGAAELRSRASGQGEGGRERACSRSCASSPTRKRNH